MRDAFTTAETSENLCLYRAKDKTSLKPELWKDHRISGTTGSYAYALDLPYIGMCLPGRLAKPCIEELPTICYSSAGFVNLFHDDGLYHLEGNCLPRDNSHVIAVRFGQNFDGNDHSFLVMRRDKDETWSYKHNFGHQACGQMKSILNVDFNGEPITDPEKAYFNKLTDFVGYFAIPYEGVLFLPKIEIPEFIWPKNDIVCEKPIPAP